MPDSVPIGQRDLVLNCVDCGADYTVTPGEQEFLRSHHLSIPKRCPRCRKWRRLMQSAETESPEENSGAQ